MRYPWNRARARGGFLTLFTALIGLVVGPSNGAAAEGRHALLVGCSEYRFASIRPLPGAANDVAAFESLLRERFGFADIVTLVGWSEDSPSSNPTYANIRGAFESLIAKVEPNSQVFILLSGHGLQLPIPKSQADVLASENPEPDGLDETFLAADYQPGINLIRDNQMAGWLDQLKKKGAHVWVVFDSCYSGTMTRGGETGEVVRGLSPEQAGISRDSIAAALESAKSSRSRSRGSLARQHQGLDLTPAETDEHAAGSLIAFYASQDFEKALEVSYPPEADPKQPENRHGLLSYHVVQALQQRSQHLTYGDLGRILVSAVRAERGPMKPTPFFEGNLEREVLGLKQWPRPEPLLLERMGNEVRLSVGTLAGVTKNSILQVFAAEDKELKHVLGHVRVLHASPTAAAVESIAYGGLEAVPLDAFPNHATCKVVAQDLGELGIGVTLLGSDHPQLQAVTKLCTEMLQSLAGPAQGIVRLVDDPTHAEWAVLIATPEAARTRLGLDLGEPSVLLLQQTEASGDFGQTANVQVHARYPATDPVGAVTRIKDDLRKIFTWRNLWQIAHAYSEDSALVDEQDLQLEVARLAGPQDTSRGTPLSSSQLRPGDYLVVRVVNTGIDPQWYTVFYLDGRFGIHYVGSGAIPGKQNVEPRIEREIERIPIDDSAFGMEGYLVIGVSQREHKIQPDYRFLAQSPVGSPNTRSGTVPPKATTAFERVLLGAAQGGQRSRGALSVDQPRIASWSWTTTPHGGSERQQPAKRDEQPKAANGIR